MSLLRAEEKQICHAAFDLEQGRQHRDRATHHGTLCSASHKAPRRAPNCQSTSSRSAWAVLLSAENLELEVFAGTVWM